MWTDRFIISRMNRGRPIEFDPQQAVGAAMELFWRRGYEATSLQALLDAMAISKSSFYQAFGNKQQLFERCLLQFRESQVRRMQAALGRSPSAMAFLRSALRAAAAEADAASAPKGCLIMNTATEFAGRDASIATLVAGGAADFFAVFHDAVRRAQQEGDIAADRKADALARYVVTTIAGLKTMVKAGLPRAAVLEVADVALGALR